MDYELMFEIEHEDVTYTIGISKVGGGTIGRRYASGYWEWFSEPVHGEEERSDRFYIGDSATHFQAATTFLQMLEDRQVSIGEDLQERVDKGVELLDSLIPKWRLLIDVDDLDMGNISKCILGQIFGGYSRGLEILGEHDSDVDGDTHGFGGDGHYGELDKLWKKAINR